MKSNIEMKTQKHCLFTKKGTRKEHTASIKLMNSLGDASARTRDDVLRFDHLLIVDTGNTHSYAAAIIAREDLREEWLDFQKDGVSLKMPTSKLDFVRIPSQLKLREGKVPRTYKQLKNEAQRQYLEQF